MSVVQLFPDPDPDARPSHSAPGPARAWLERTTALPSPARLGSTMRWWCTVGLGKLGVLVVRAPLLLVLELRPIGVGLGRMMTAWAGWVAAIAHAEALRAAESHSEKYASELLATQKGRRRLSLGVAVVLAGATWWAVAVYPLAVILTIGLVVLVADAVGRRVAPQETKLPAPARAVLQEGVPLTQVTRALVDRAGERWGIELGIARAMTYSPARREYEVWVTSSEALTADIMRDFERAIGATDHAMRCLAPPDGQASVRRLVIREGDPLAVPVPAPQVRMGGTVADWVELGVSMTDVPFALPYAGVHHRKVMMTGGGKTAWAIRSTIRGLAPLRDVVLGGIDITNGPELTLWRDVIQYKGLDVAGAERVLDKALAEIDRRSRILTAIAEDDDPDNDATEWHSGLGPAFIIVIDEFAQLAAFDGKGGRPNLLAKAEQIVRTGRKHWVSLDMYTQRTGNDDFGSTTMSSQCAVTVAGPCEPADAVRMFGVDQRDAGYTPHLLRPGVQGDARDAGKVMISSPMHRTPDYYRYYAPGTTAEVKRLARQLVDAGLPSLGDTGLDEAVVVDPLLAEAERAFDTAGADRLPSAVLLEHLQVADPDTWGPWTQVRLAEALRDHGMRPRGLNLPDGTNPRGYLRAELDAALQTSERTDA